MALSEGSPRNIINLFFDAHKNILDPDDQKDCLSSTYKLSKLEEINGIYFNSMFQNIVIKAKQSIDKHRREVLEPLSQLSQDLRSQCDENADYMYRGAKKPRKDQGAGSM